MNPIPHRINEYIGENACGSPLFIDLHTSLRFAMSLLELEGWIDQARRAYSVGSLTQTELDALLETAQNLAADLREQ